MNNLILMLSAVFCLIPVINIIFPDYFNYVVRMSFSSPIKHKYDFLFVILMFVEVCYILLGFTTPLASIFILLLVYEIMVAVGITLTNKVAFYCYEVLFLIINLFIFVELYEKI